jgi:hypothetical protein
MTPGRAVTPSQLGSRSTCKADARSEVSIGRVSSSDNLSAKHYFFTSLRGFFTLCVLKTWKLGCRLSYLLFDHTKVSYTSEAVASTDKAE